MNPSDRRGAAAHPGPRSDKSLPAKSRPTDDDAPPASRGKRGGGVTRAAQDDAQAQQSRAADERDKSAQRSAEATDDELRLPHERDQSADQLSTQSASVRRKGRQAHEDVERGLVDTDQGYVAEGVKPGHEKGKPGGGKARPAGAAGPKK